MQDVDIYISNVSAICGYLNVCCLGKHLTCFGADNLTFDILGIVLRYLCFYSHLCFISPNFKPHYRRPSLALNIIMKMSKSSIEHFCEDVLVLR